MRVKMRLAASSQWKEVELADGVRVKDLLEKFKYHPASLALISVNGVPASTETQLRDGDEVVLVPIVDGGTSSSEDFELFEA